MSQPQIFIATFLSVSLIFSASSVQSQEQVNVFLPLEAGIEVNISDTIAVSAVQTTAPEAKKVSGLARQFLAAHNAVRSRYGVPPLEWNRSVARFARRHAHRLSFTCDMDHSTDSPYGENIFWAKREHRGPGDAVGWWANENEYYDPKTNSCTENKVCGHFTNLVWKNTKQVGCARVECTSGRGYIFVCSYNPPGNVMGQHPYGYPLPISTARPSTN